MNIMELIAKIEKLSLNKAVQKHQSYSELSYFLSRLKSLAKEKRNRTHYFSISMPGFSLFTPQLPADFFLTLRDAPKELLAFLEEWREGSVFKNERSDLESMDPKVNPYLIPLDKLLVVDGYAYHLDNVMEDLRVAEEKDINNSGKKFVLYTFPNYHIAPERDILSDTRYQKIRSFLAKHPATSEYISRAMERDAGRAREAIAKRSLQKVAPCLPDIIPETRPGAAGLFGSNRNSDNNSRQQSVLKVRLPDGAESEYKAHVSNPGELNQYCFTVSMVLKLRTDFFLALPGEVLSSEDRLKVLEQFSEYSSLSSVEKGLAERIAEMNAEMNAEENNVPRHGRLGG